LNKKKFNTRVIHEGQIPEKEFGSVSKPIYQTSTFKQEEFGKYIYDYSRAGNPTRTDLETNIASLEDGDGAVMFGSGLAAISAIFTLLKTGDHIISNYNVYGGTFRLIDKILLKMGVNVSWVDTSSIDEIKSALSSNTKMILIETPTNPMMQLTDIAEVASFAKNNNILSVIDNTFMSPYCQRPLNLGIDLVVHSTTKYINGHSDVIGGVVVSKDKALLEELHFIQMSVGAVPGPFDCWLTQRAIKTLALRMKAHNHNAMIIAKELESNAKVDKVYYPGLKSHPQHELARKQQIDPDGNSVFGGMISIDLLDADKAAKFVKNLQLFILAESLGGVESLVCHPASMTHASIPEDIRKKIGLSDGLVRLSVGIEHPDDLLEDIKSALKNI
jgi:cystathionine beta-lyase/cystathionine gamma-synthase|tara:strand:+ start:1293 stop:2456 length:1164 start_codon:yes stop_codon:yes gene_type:complete